RPGGGRVHAGESRCPRRVLIFTLVIGRIGRSFICRTASMRASPLMLAIALGLGVSLTPGAADARQVPSPQWAKADGRQTWIVVFEEAPAASFRGFEPGDARRPKLAATSPAATGADRYDARSPEALAYTDYLGDLQRM